MSDEVQTVARPAEMPCASMRRARLLRTLLILSALAGCVICVVLIRLAAPSEDAPSVFGSTLCAPTNKVDCGYVLHSRWSKIGPIPSSILGLVYYTFIAVWFSVIGVPNYGGRRWHWLPTLLITCGMASSLFFTYILVFVLPVLCTWCVASHVANLFCFAFVWMVWPRARDAQAGTPPYPSASRVGAVVVIAGSVLLAVVLGIGAYNAQVYARGIEKRYLTIVNDPKYLHWCYTQEQQYEIPVRPDDVVLGPADAPYTLVVFSDFECAKCAQFHHYAKSIVDRFEGRIRCVFRHYPVSRECNPHIPTAFHFFSCEAAHSAEAARIAGTPEQAHRYFAALYQQRHRLDERPYAEIAASVGIDASRFAETMKDESIDRRIAEDIELAYAVGVEGTPSLYLNGRLLPNWQILTVDKQGRQAKPGTQPVIDVKATLELWRLYLGEV